MLRFLYLNTSRTGIPRRSHPVPLPDSAHAQPAPVRANLPAVVLPPVATAAPWNRTQRHGALQCRLTPRLPSPRCCSLAQFPSLRASSARAPPAVSSARPFPSATAFAPPSSAGPILCALGDRFGACSSSHRNKVSPTPDSISLGSRRRLHRSIRGVAFSRTNQHRQLLSSITIVSVHRCNANNTSIPCLFFWWFFDPFHGPIQIRKQLSLSIFASDGLWEHLSNQEAIKLVQSSPRNRNVCSLILCYN
jgi:hypothetical protein